MQASKSRIPSQELANSRHAIAYSSGALPFHVRFLAWPAVYFSRASCLAAAAGDFLAELDAVIATRDRERPAVSSTTRLFDDGVRAIAQKVGEEGVETALAAVVQDDAALCGEAAELLFLRVLLRALVVAG